MGLALIALAGFLARVAARHADLVTLVRLSSIVCAGGPCPMVVDGVELRPGDGGHLSIDGAQTVAERLIDAVVEARIALRDPRLGILDTRRGSR